MRKRTFVWLIIGFFGASCFPTFSQEGSTEIETGEPCTVDVNCDDGNPCTSDLCSAATLVCEHTSQASGAAPAAVQTPADCMTIVCDAGTPSAVEDPQDFMNDNNSCTVDACNNGVPTNEITPDGSACNLGTKQGTCNAGTCTISCMNNKDCDDGNPCSEDLCNTSTSRCVYANIDGVATPGVTPVVGDCKGRTCDKGVDVETNDDADVLDDNNPCTSDVCVNGMPQNNNIAEGTACAPGDKRVCDGNGDCKNSNGMTCLMGTECVSTFCADGVCCNSSCTMACKSCNVVGNIGICSNLPALTDDGTCSGNNTCNGMGTCLKDSGQPCSMNAECASGTCLGNNTCQ